jgi:hypothetical protein
MFSVKYDEMFSVESDQDGGHVIASEAGHGIPGEQFIEQFLHDGFVLFLFAEFFAYQVDQSLAVLYVPLPYPITPHHYELVLL